VATSAWVRAATEKKAGQPPELQNYVFSSLAFSLRNVQSMTGILENGYGESRNRKASGASQWLSLALDIAIIGRDSMARVRAVLVHFLQVNQWAAGDSVGSAIS
jgi:hypothetical protein